MLIWKFSGDGAWELFQAEGGGHRWQRVPPTEKRGRTQTSSVTVAVLRESAGSKVEVSASDIRIDTYTGSGPGGQHRNRTASAVRITHKPSGIVVTCENERSQHQNKYQAMASLTAKLAEQKSRQDTGRANSTRRKQIGTGYRGDKIRTVQEQNGRVTNHTNGKKCSLKAYLKGDLKAIQ